MFNPRGMELCFFNTNSTIDLYIYIITMENFVCFFFFFLIIVQSTTNNISNTTEGCFESDPSRRRFGFGLTR